MNAGDGGIKEDEMLQLRLCYLLVAGRTGLSQGRECERNLF